MFKCLKENVIRIREQMSNSAGPSWCCIYSMFSHCLKYWYLTKMPVGVPGAPLAVQLPASAPAKAVEDGPSTLQPYGRSRWSSCLLGSAWPSRGHQSHLGSEPVYERALSFSPPSQLCLSLKEREQWVNRWNLIHINCETAVPGIHISHDSRLGRTKGQYLWR